MSATTTSPVPGEEDGFAELRRAVEAHVVLLVQTSLEVELALLDLDQRGRRVLRQITEHGVDSLSQILIDHAAEVEAAKSNSSDDADGTEAAS